MNATIKILIVGFCGFSLTLIAAATQSIYLLYALGGVAYFLFGIFLPEVRKSSKLTFTLFSPYLIELFITLPTSFGNPSLFPWLFPIVPILFYFCFLSGSLLKLWYTQKKYTLATLALLSVISLIWFSIIIVLPPAYSFGERTMKYVQTVREKREVDRVRVALNTLFKSDGNCYNFGTITMKDSVIYKYKIYNAQADTLFITKVESSCGCIVSSFTKDPILHDEFGEVVVLVKPVQKGAALNSIVVQTNDPNKPFYSFQLSGIVSSE